MWCLECFMFAYRRNKIIIIGSQNKTDEAIGNLFMEEGALPESIE